MIGLVICHKSLASELIETTQAVIGHHGDLFAFSNDKLTIEQLLRDIEDFLKSQGNPDQAVIMVDLRGGNCWSVAKMLNHSHPQYFILSGVNLPMLFSFLTKKDKLSPEQLVETMEKDAHRGILLEK